MNIKTPVKNLVCKFIKKASKFLAIFALIFAWIFSGWPTVWQNPRIPSEINEAKADTTNLVVTSCDVEDVNDTTCYNAIVADGGTDYALEKGDHIDAPFQTLSSVASVTSATLYYDSSGSLTGSWAVYVKDARDGNTICSVNPAPEDGSETRNSFSCNSITPSQLSSGVWLQIDNNDDKGPESITLDYVYLYVDYSPATISITISDMEVLYGIVATSADTTGGGGDTQTVTNNGNVAEDFDIKGQNSANWTLGASAGDAIYKHAWCTSDCDGTPTWNALTTAYDSNYLATNIASLGTQDFDLQVTVPTSNAGTSSQNVSVFILATQH